MIELPRMTGTMKVEAKVSKEMPPRIRGSYVYYTHMRMEEANGKMKVTFLDAGVELFSITCHMPNFSRGESLNLTGVDGKVEIEFCN